MCPPIFELRKCLQQPEDQQAKRLGRAAEQTCGLQHAVCWLPAARQPAAGVRRLAPKKGGAARVGGSRGCPPGQPALGRSITMHPLEHPLDPPSELRGLEAADRPHPGPCCSATAATAAARVFHRLPALHAEQTKLCAALESLDAVNLSLRHSESPILSCWCLRSRMHPTPTALAASGAQWPSICRLRALHMQQKVRT